MLATWWPEVHLSVSMALAVGEGFTLDDPDTGTLDTGNLIGSASALGWVDLIDITTRVATRYGSRTGDRALTNQNAGSLSFSVYDPGREYLPGSASLVFPRLIAGVPVQVTATLAADGVTRTLFTGQLSDAVNEGGQTTFECTDLVATLAGYDALEQPPVGAGETASARVNRWLDVAEVPAEQRDITAGGVTLVATNLAEPLWNGLCRTAAADFGRLWVDRDNVVHYRPGGWYSELPDPAVALDLSRDPVVSAAQLTNGSDIRNVIDAARVDGNVRTSTDPVSTAVHGARRWGRRDLELTTDADVDLWAQLVLAGYATPYLQIPSLVLRPDVRPPVPLWAAVLDADTDQLWTIDAGAANLVTVWVAGVEHSITPTSWTTTITTGRGYEELTKVATGAA